MSACGVKFPRVNAVQSAVQLPCWDIKTLSAAIGFIMQPPNELVAAQPIISYWYVGDLLWRPSAASLLGLEPR